MPYATRLAHPANLTYLAFTISERFSHRCRRRASARRSAGL